MASPQRLETMQNLPDDVLSNIFIRLLAKQLAQMRCLSKTWNILLSESSFVKSHLHRSIHNNDEILLFFRLGTTLNCTPFTFTTRPSASPHLELTNFIKLPVSLQFKNAPGNVIGSVNGLICLNYGSQHDHAIKIWNPSLSAVLTLPPCLLPCGVHSAFGYDPKTDDYKVIKFIKLLQVPNMVPQGAIYSMRKGYWELISQRFPSHITMLRDRNEVCVGGHTGHLHWLCDTNLAWKPTIVAFDLGAETFHEIPFPNSIIENNQHWFNVLGVLGGKLCVMSCFIGGECEVWVMDEYGVAESWVKNHVFSHFSSDITPYGFTLHNEFLFEVDDRGRFALYDPIAAKTKLFKIKLIGLTFINRIVGYVDSLVWITPGSKL